MIEKIVFWGKAALLFLGGLYVTMLIYVHYIKPQPYPSALNSHAQIEVQS